MNSLSFNVEKFVFTKKEQELDLSFIPANTRRRLNLFDKHVLYLINECLDDGVENIVLSSRYGEFDRLLRLIEQAQETNEVSPMAFSASVHNYSLGQFSLLKQNTIPTISISAGEDSFYAGFVTAASMNEKKNVYCYADNSDDEIFGMCFMLNLQGNDFKLKSKEIKSLLNINSVVDFFENEKESDLFERVK